MKRKIYIFLGLFFFLAIIIVIAGEINRMAKETKKDDRQDETLGIGMDASDTDVSTKTDADCYSYSDVEKVVSYLAASEESGTQLARLVDPLSKSNPITVSYVKNIVKIIGAPDTVYQDYFKGRGEESLVSREEFDEIYHNMVDSDVVNGLERREILVFDVAWTEDEENREKIYVSDGTKKYDFQTAYEENYLDRVLDVYVKNSVIFKVNGFGHTKIPLEHVWMLDTDSTKCTFLYKGIIKSYPINNGTVVKKDCVGTLFITDAGVAEFDDAYEVIEGRVVSVEGDIRLDGTPSYAYDDNFAVYNISDDVSFMESRPPLLGYGTVKLLVKDKKACAAVTYGDAECETIRVILSNHDFTSYKMAKLTLSSEDVLKVIYPDGGEKTFPAGEMVTIQYEDYEDGDKIIIEQTGKGKGITIHSIARECGAPVYDGFLELDIQDDSMYVINELPLEQYLYGVVSSEAPSSYENEALKAIAVCARAYAYGKMKDGSFDEYNADLDDSVFCQMYNDVLKTPESIRAVDETYGIVPIYDGEVVFPLYFSTSCGMTCTNSEIWGGTPYPYFTSNVEDIEKSELDLSDEDAFVQFMEDSLGYDTIEKNLPYYRWSIYYTREDISKAVNRKLSERLDTAAGSIRVKNDNGDFVDGDITDIGDVVSVGVSERSSSGMVLALWIEGTKETILVKGQANIRNLITPVNQNIVRQDGSVVTGWNSLPSTFYYITESDGGFTIYGGGFGHGAGLSQNGANALAAKGYHYTYIIRHYFSSADFEMIYEFLEEDGEE
ncbi:MAG: SpoIID/LytB domain-containing protein [Ruminococcus sp.]|nr:SpoIID/LytB domain-containing protein [Ruminococcus sp.]